MIQLRRAEERHCDRDHQQEVWLTFDPLARGCPLERGFGALTRLEEDRLPPGAGVPGPANGLAEIVTYVREGTLAYEDSAGRSGVIHAGEFQRRTTGSGLRTLQRNPSLTDWVHLFQLALGPTESTLVPSDEHKRFSAAERRGTLCVVASCDGRRGSLRLQQDARLYSAMLAPGQHVVHELTQGRRAWVHLVLGEATLGDLVLTAGDGAGITAERAVSLTARKEAEILLIDLRA